MAILNRSIGLEDLEANENSCIVQKIFHMKQD